VNLLYEQPDSAIATATRSIFIATRVRFMVSPLYRRSRVLGF
jgi:hypothetical protein